MPRIPNPTILRAHQQHPLLPLLLRECRSLESAKNELRWLHESASRLVSSKRVARSVHAPLGWRRLLRLKCHARSKGKPLQYILGDQPFGDLEILCKKGVLIPRTETESFTIHAARLILDDIRKHERRGGEQQGRCLRIADLCTGSGCIALLLHALLAPHIHQLSILGIDISPVAIELANRNLAHNVQLGLLSNRAAADVSFRQGNVLANDSGELLAAEQVLRSVQGTPFNAEPHCDVLISNPPYISPESFRDGTTSRSVRVFEPRLALVPMVGTSNLPPGIQNEEDHFYYHIVLLSFKIHARLVVLECGNRSQAERVAATSRTLFSDYQLGAMSIAIWPSARASISDHISGNEPCIVVIHK